MKKVIMLIFVASILFTGCTQGSTTDDAEGAAFAEQLSGPSNGSAAKDLEGEVLFYPTYNEDYKTGNNFMYDFWFDIPVSWNAVDESEDGSEYSILCDNDKVQIKIFGVLIDGAEEDYYNELAGESGTISEFIYRDSWIGKKVEISPNEVYFVRVDGDSYIVMHVDSSEAPEWMVRNEEIVNYIAMSARTSRESMGKDNEGDSSITTSDLKLGKINVSMSYEELLEAMEQEPSDVIEEQYEGMSTKTLFFPDETQVYVVNDTVYTVNVTSPNYQTPRGLRTGDSEDRIAELYGEPNKQENGIWGYNINGYELFTAVAENGVVTQIQIEQGSWSSEVF